LLGETICGIVDNRGVSYLASAEVATKVEVARLTKVKKARERVTDKARHQAAFLAYVSEVPDVVKAAEVAGIGRTLHYNWMREDPTYPERFAEAWEAGIDALEAACQRRAMVGYEKPIYYKGEPVGTEIVYSDRLAEFLLTGNRPARYRPKGLDIEIHMQDLSSQLSEARRRVPDAIDVEVVRPALPAPAEPTDH
jgi:hypothetical protein